MTTPARQVELAIGGMTCASCAARIEKRLNRLDGVSATVNYATEKASVTYPDTLGIGDLVATVEATGYTATPSRDGAPDEEAELAGLRRRLWASAVRAVPVVLVSMVPALRFTGTVPSATLVQEMEPLAQALAERVKKQRQDDADDGSEADE